MRSEPTCIDLEKAPGFFSNSSVWISLQDGQDLDRKPKVFKTQVLDVTSREIVIEQPFEHLGERFIGRVFNVSWLVKDSQGEMVRMMLDTVLLRLDTFSLQSGPAQSLVFGPLKNYYTGSLRRHFRVPVPVSEEVHVVVSDAHGRPLGPRDNFPIVDICLFGLRFSCSDFVLIKGQPVRDPVGKLQVRERIWVAIIIEQEEIFKVEAAIRTVLRPLGPESSVVHLGIEFMNLVEQKEEDGLETLTPFNDAHSQGLVPHIYRYQRMSLRKDRRAS